MTHRHGRTILVVAAALALVASACGTRVDREAYYQGRSANLAAGQPLYEQPLDGDATDGAFGEPASGDPSSTGPAAPASGGAQATTSARDPAAAGTTPAQARAPAPATVRALSAERVGDIVDIGLHVPVTGAAPLPTDFQDTIDVVQQWMNDNPVHGRRVRFVVEDDGYEPAKGQAACRKLAGSDPLLVIGHTMPAVQDGCAALFDERGIPYLMRGTDERLLEGRPHAWFGTISDDLQGRLLGQYALARLGARTKKVAVVYQNDQTVAQAGFVDVVTAGGAALVAREESVPRQPDYGATIQKLRGAGAEIVLLSMPPVDAIKISVQSQGQGYRPQWLGGATHWNYNMTIEAAGMALDGAVAFSPWPTIDSAAASDFVTAYRQYRQGRDPQDIGLIVWGWAMLVRSALDKAGPDLSRASLATALQDFTFAPAYWQPIRYAPGSNAGATTVAVFRADGSSKRWVQTDGFTGGF